MNWLRRIFRRASAPAAGPPAAPPAPPAGEVETWHAGDIAECIHRGAWFDQLGLPGTGPKFGDRGRVVAVVRPTGQRRSFLRLAGRDGSVYHAALFRKVLPRADELVAADADFPECFIRRPETVARLARWQLRAELAIICVAGLICSDALLGALTRVPG